MSDLHPICPARAGDSPRGPGYSPGALERLPGGRMGHPTQAGECKFTGVKILLAKAPK